MKYDIINLMCFYIFNFYKIYNYFNFETSNLS